MHTIRLRGLWQIEALAQVDSNPLPMPAETNVPGDWSNALGRDFVGTARFIRRFGQPTNLEPHERVTLVVGEIESQATIKLNGTRLGEQHQGDGERRYEVTNLLKLRNELQIVVESTDSTGGIRGEVKLEIS